MKKKRKAKWEIRNIAGTYLVLLIFAAIWILPLIIAVVKSFTINGFGNYAYVLNYDKINYFRVIFNSMTIAVTSAVVVTLITALAAYAFSKMKFPGSRIIYGAILACLAVPVAAVTSPLFATIKNMGLLDHHLGVIIPLIAFNAPMMLLMIKNYFDTIPDELLESARIDGASRFRIWYVFMVPLSVPMIANVLVLTFIYSWNDYLVPLLVMRSEENYPVTLAAQYFMSSTYQSPEDVARIYAVMILLALPSILVYLVSQRFLVAGATAGAVKG
ncbi:MAG TPA: carbohydrate ABC transporter permease [Candidatus Blautia stercorigallinarum]|uniref:Carbohydrate ABC transporter permease n=1 Tax=Candidatus Blautia stercorigallinarum TaxID=2838501 RepID=A0A9D1PCB7_9FIRM|nr:carbohydrate ABC transporter permease [Candidatus Blautia stercorigallinarum]